VAEKLTRREFVVGGAAVAAAVALPQVAFPKSNRIAIWRLQPLGVCSGGTTACRTCASYDGHTLFPTEKAANGNRAHIGCDCCLQQGTIDYGGYVALFGPPGDLKAYRVDTRSREVAAILKQHPPLF
jgi:TAT (twin-arginine translocation) pathway signal sequence